MVYTISYAIESLYVKGKILKELKHIFYNKEAVLLAEWCHEETIRNNYSKAKSILKVVEKLENMYNPKRNKKTLVNNREYIRNGYRLERKPIPPMVCSSSVRS